MTSFASSYFNSIVIAIKLVTASPAVTIQDDATVNCQVSRAYILSIKTSKIYTAIVAAMPMIGLDAKNKYTKPKSMIFSYQWATSIIASDDPENSVVRPLTSSWCA